MKETTYQIYDKIFKRVFTLSNISIVNMINGLFHTNYPLESKVTCPSKEFVNRNLSSRLADMIIIINETNAYHFEAQIYHDKDIVLRIFEMGFGLLFTTFSVTRFAMHTKCKKRILAR